MNEKWIKPDGDACKHETHRFRIGIDDREATEFTSGREGFPDALTNAMIEHVAAGRKGAPGKGVDIQVLCGAASWRNIQNPNTGGIMAINNQIAGERAVSKTIFDWACRSVDMARKIERLAEKLSDEE